ncbi:MAG: pyrroline-5-carboxylate reductase [Gammaproteobacteria bacterium]|nr:pyrroline-5-carboxylate reductase [Gammaproteobacteria bacterium]MDH5660668.1 pyrroline-5-carboxylate reductase [Gammaproteobacteria bacterium]
MDNQKIGFIGAGNMARSLIGGLISSGIKNTHLFAADPNEDIRNALEKDFEIQTFSENQQLVDQCDVVVFAVKPQALKTVATSITAKESALYLTIAAGIPSESLNNWLNSNKAIVRSMPNTPSLVLSGASGLFANSQVNEEQRETAESILRAVGLTVWVNDEKQLDAVTALSGSGPAYFFMVMEAMEKAGVELGLPADTARLLAIQTGFGATKLALEVDDAPAVLRQKVTSPGGTTEQAIKIFEEKGLTEIFSKAMKAAHDRAEELADELGK